MSTPNRLLMMVDLAGYSEEHRAALARQIQDEDAERVGHLMLEAYRGTIDYAGESLSDSVQEVRGTLAGKYGKPIAPACLVMEVDGQAASAVIFTWYEKEQMPLLTFSITDSAFKGRGFAKELIVGGLVKLKALGYSKCCLVVTEGNEPAFSIYRKLGFQVERVL